MQTDATQRDPQAMLERALHEWGGRDDLWLFAYGSLIWRREFSELEERHAMVHGWHRALRMRSNVNRGTPERPGLVFALVHGGACRGMVYRLDRATARDDLAQLWVREMPNGVYDPRWLRCRTPQGPVRALAFTLGRRSPALLDAPGDAQMLEILRVARGRYGTTLDYLLDTAQSLRRCGIRDREIERLTVLAERLAR